MVRDASDEGQFLLATLPPSKRHIRLALGLVAALLVSVLVMAPFANIPLPQVGAFYPVVLSVNITADLITSALLFSQFFVVGRTALFVLAIGYLFTGLMMIPFMLTFPGAFSSTGLLGAGLQSALYLSLFFRAGASLGVIGYALLRNAGSTTSMSGRSPLIVIICSTAAVIAIVCGLTWLATAGEALLPIVFVDSRHTANHGALMVQVVILLSLYALALALLWARRPSVLDLWLMVMCCKWLLFLVTSNFLSDDRFTVGWYGARGYEVIAVMVVLVALLSETTALYAKLARTVVRERGAREARQVAMDAMAAAIAHELKQPLAAIAINGRAGLRWMAKPDLHEARAAIERMVSNAHRASEVIDGIRALFKRKIQGRESVNVNDVIRQALTTVDFNLRAERVLVSTELREGLPQLLANRAQLEEVFLNLIMNSVEAMHSVTDRARLLRLSSDIIQESATVLVTVEDAGAGIDSKDTERIFEPFFTTKSGGTGIGLAICRAIAESHGGSLRASANNPYGTIFHVALPTS